MNIIHIIPGSGGSFYCGNCLRDSKYVDSLKKLGHTVVKVPMYLPLFSDEHDLEDIPVFYGAISIYLKQLYPIFRKAPAWVDRLLNSKPMMRPASFRVVSLMRDFFSIPIHAMVFNAFSKCLYFKL